MICIVATLTAAEGKGPDFEAAFSDLTAKVKANEPGCLVYQLTKSRTDANVYKVLEVYTSQDAVDAHMGSDYFKAAGAKLAGVLAGRPVLEFLDGIE